METLKITAQIKDASQKEAIKAFMRALDIKFEFFKDSSTYDPEFVKKIQQGDKDLKNNKGRKVYIEELDNLWK